MKNRSLLWTLTATAGISVANLYYNQPLLADIGRAFHALPRQVSAVPTFTQIGYAAGMLTFVPLGDLLERRKLILSLLLASAFFLFIAGFAPTLVLLVAASFFIGFTTSVVQVVIPLAAFLSDPEQQGKTIGRMMGGVSLGILLARTLSGFVGGRFGWRIMYFTASLLCLALALLVRSSIDRVPPHEVMRYRQVLRSLVHFAAEFPVLRRASLIGGCLFGAFSAFWTTLVFELESPHYHLGSQAAGLFGLVGCAGVLAAPLAGRAADRMSTHAILLRAIALTVFSFLVLWFGSRYLAGLIIGVILLDAGVQASQVSNQARIFRLRQGAQSRINTVYMISYFTGGALGSAAGAFGWSRASWTGVCIVGLVFTSVALAAHLLPMQEASQSA